tara:strand:+ start:5621 stop:5998 length:378 start_codon:yes stop_codon:yes gene_type:complete
MNRNDYDCYCESKYLLINPFKLRKVADCIRSKTASESLLILKVMPQRGATFLYKALNSAISNGIHNKKLNVDDLYISSVIIDEGKKLKRFQARARGRAFSIIKRTSHIKIGLKAINSGDKNGTKG